MSLAAWASMPSSSWRATWKPCERSPAATPRRNGTSDSIGRENWFAQYTEPAAAAVASTIDRRMIVHINRRSGAKATSVRISSTVRHVPGTYGLRSVVA